MQDLQPETTEHQTNADTTKPVTQLTAVSKCHMLCLLLTRKCTHLVSEQVSTAVKSVHTTCQRRDVSLTHTLE